MKPYEIAEQGIARTFQNIALFHGMTTVENVMTGRQLMMKKNFFGRCYALVLRWMKRWNIGANVRKLLIFWKFSQSEKRRLAVCLTAYKSRLNWHGTGHGTKALLLDEPMAGMNVEEKEDMSRFAMM